MSKAVPKFCVDSGCLPLRHFEAAMRSLADAGAAGVFFAISDGNGSPLAGAGPALVAAAGGLGLERHVHLIATHPEKHVNTFAAMKCERLTFQVEGCIHPHRVLGHIRSVGMSPGVAVSPGTPLTKLDYLLELADRVLLLGLEPGTTEGRARDAIFERVKLLEDNIRYRELHTAVGVGGGLDAAMMAKAARFGAKSVVVDASWDGWAGAESPGAAIAALHDAVAAAMKTA